MYGSLSANGYLIQASAEHTVPQEIMQDFMAQAHRHKNMIIGHNTYELMQAGARAGAFEGIEVVVVSDKNEETPGAHRVSSPQAAVEYLQQKGL